MSSCHVSVYACAGASLVVSSPFGAVQPTQKLDAPSSRTGKSYLIFKKLEVNIQKISSHAYFDFCYIQVSHVHLVFTRGNTLPVAVLFHTAARETLV